MHGCDDRTWLVFNGEIYNHALLRADLEKRGHKYASRTDSETILHLYEERGLDFIHDIEGDYGIAVPATAERVTPQVLLVPCVGIDAQRYRLGYGGGFYDRTLGAMAVRPVTVGVAFDVARIASIAAQPHDVRLDLAITESGVL